MGNLPNLISTIASSSWWFRPISVTLVKLDHLPTKQGKVSKHSKFHHLEFVVFVIEFIYEVRING